jgi:hypothetical protein
MIADNQLSQAAWWNAADIAHRSQRRPGADRRRKGGTSKREGIFVYLRDFGVG